MITDEMLEQAAKKAEEMILRGLEEGGETEHEFSPRFERKMKALMRCGPHYKRRMVQRAACVLLALLLTGGLLAMNGDVRAAVLGWTRRKTESRLSYTYQGTAGEQDEADYRPHWLPDGYTQTEIFYSQTGSQLHFTGSDGSLLRFGYTLYGIEAFEAGPGYESRAASVGGREAVLYLGAQAGEAVLTWTNGEEASFFVAGALDAEVLIRVAESVAMLEYEPQWIPEGFREIARDRNSSRGRIVYRSDAGEVIAFFYVTYGMVSLRVDGNELRSVSVNGRFAELYLDEQGSHTLAWESEDGQILFVLDGAASPETLLKIAESITKISQ